MNSHISPQIEAGFSVCSENFDFTYHENWLIKENVCSGAFRSIEYNKGTNYLLGSASAEFKDNQQFKNTINELYKDIFDCIDGLGYPNLARVWNFIPDIHVKDDIDRYQYFCQARHMAFETRFANYREVLPAATAVGISGQHLHLYFIASNFPVQFCENSRQCRAYDYPPQYGPKSPSFARASLIKQGVPMLLISGTASVLGYESVHINDVEAQTRETLNNISVLITDTNIQHSTYFDGLDSLLHVKVYVRKKEDIANIKKILGQYLSEHVERIFIIADICREDLLVEIEAIARQSR